MVVELRKSTSYNHTLYIIYIKEYLVKRDTENSKTHLDNYYNETQIGRVMIG